MNFYQPLSYSMNNLDPLEQIIASMDRLKAKFAADKAQLEARFGHIEKLFEQAVLQEKQQQLQKQQQQVIPKPPPSKEQMQELSSAPQEEQPLTSSALTLARNTNDESKEEKEPATGKEMEDESQITPIASTEKDVEIQAGNHKGLYLIDGAASAAKPKKTAEPNTAISLPQWSGRSNYKTEPEIGAEEWGWHALPLSVFKEHQGIFLSKARKTSQTHADSTSAPQFVFGVLNMQCWNFVTIKMDMEVQTVGCVWQFIHLGVDSFLRLDDGDIEFVRRQFDPGIWRTPTLRAR